MANIHLECLMLLKDIVNLFMKCIYMYLYMYILYITDACGCNSHHAYQKNPMFFYIHILLFHFLTSHLETRGLLIRWGSKIETWISTMFFCFVLLFYLHVHVHIKLVNLSHTFWPKSCNVKIGISKTHLLRLLVIYIWLGKGAHF